jgi:outer membrane protein
VNKSLFGAPLLALGLGALAFGQSAAPPNRVGIIHIQNAIAQTRDGQKAAAEMQAKYGPRQREIEGRQAELQQLEAQYRSTANTMSDEARQKMMRDIDQRRKQLQRNVDDAQAELQQDQDHVLQELGQKMMAVIDRYASERGYSLILDVATTPTPVIYASNTIDITRDIVDLYDKMQAAGLAAPAAATSGAPAPSRPPVAAPKPAPPKK